MIPAEKKKKVEFDQSKTESMFTLNESGGIKMMQKYNN